MAVAALIIGIISILLDVFPLGAFVGVFFGLVAMILGIVARKKAKADNVPTGMATAGMALGITGLALGVIFISACMYCAKVGSEMNKELEQQRQNDPAFKKQMDDFNKALKEGDKVKESDKAPALPAK